MMEIYKPKSFDVKSLLSDFVMQRFLTEQVMRFADETSIPEILTSLGFFTMEEAIDAIQQRLGWKFLNRTRVRMIKIMIDLLKECECIERRDNLYTCSMRGDLESGLSMHDREQARAVFKGQVDFFEKCIAYANDFLRGNPSLYSFDNNSTDIWEKFLGNVEFQFARNVLINILFSGRGNEPKVLDLCYGTGFDILQMQENYPNIRVTALDFQDIFQDIASRRLLNHGSIEWVKSELWKGFGNPLPFPDNTFDIIFFSCADPYIPEELRKYVYRDIFRVLKQRGSLGILTHSYPDNEMEYVRDKWARRGILCHDFAESVCEGWHGFYDANESVTLFNAIGYSINRIMLNASIWRLDKP